jgi:hypothetical protein
VISVQIQAKETPPLIDHFENAITWILLWAG